MKKIGLIDHYLDNWHANNLPRWLKDEAGDKYKICYAWGSLPMGTMKPNGEGAKPSALWCAEQGIELCSSAAEVVEKSDVLLVLAPNNPETHPELCRDAFASGKRTYVDKTFATDAAAAKALIEAAKAGNTPMFSSSALRFSTELKDVERKGLKIINSRGPGSYDIYSIHQIEMIVALFGPEFERVMAIGDETAPALVIEFSGKRFATIGHFGWQCPFNMALAYENGEHTLIKECSDYFPNFVHELVDFFETGDIKVPFEETIAVIAIRELGAKALRNPGVWFERK
ncbi:MAG: Gfo/Idh/MocA family oxidoreductase [Clostridiales bacterium]|jgi:hypothetical protein|nr:Gfo/Idh/MocA family oxidoreductase [Clostridiales bacterium]